MMEYCNRGMVDRRNTGTGGPRFVVAGRDRARPSSVGLLPVFQDSIIPFQVTPSLIPDRQAVRLHVAHDGLDDVLKYLPF
jgi:hypothetical protein